MLYLFQFAKSVGVIIIGEFYYSYGRAEHEG